MPADGRAISRFPIELFIGPRAAPFVSPTLPAKGLFPALAGPWLKPRGAGDWLNPCVEALNVGLITECGGIDAGLPAFAPRIAPRDGVTLTWPIGAFAS